MVVLGGKVSADQPGPKLAWAMSTFLVEQGIVEEDRVLDERSEGMKVRVEFLTTASAEVDDSLQTSTLYERMKDFIGTAKNLPPDASINIDHYLYGHPKK
jgi:hypothetical protein